jgi:hypothetical protein
MRDGRELFRGSEREAGHVRKRCLDDRHANEIARNPVLESAVRSLLNDDLQSRMTRLHADERAGDAVDKKYMLADRGQYADGGAPPLRWRAFLPFGEPTGSRLDEARDFSKMFTPRGRKHAVAPALKESAADRLLDLPDLLAERGLAHVTRAGGRCYPPGALGEGGVANLAQGEDGSLDMRFAFGERAAQMLGKKLGQRPWPEGSRDKPQP